MKPTLRVTELLAESGSDRAHMPPTILYNEGWMLRLVLDWCATHSDVVEPFAFLPDARWYSEALLPSRFGGRGHPSEGFTHADAVIGHFRFRPGGRGDIEILPGAKQFSVVEAKMGSLLSVGISNADFFNQAARNVACIANMVALSQATSTLERLSFTVIAPQRRIDEKAFEDQLDVRSLTETVRKRTSMFDGKQDDWFSAAFMSLLPRIQVQAVSWERVIERIASFDEHTGDELREFLSSCLRFNPMSPHRPRIVDSTVPAPAV
jgi:hypothetical protein